MTKEELKSTPQILTICDLMEIFECGRTKAESIMRGIKSVSNIIGLKGKIAIKDYELWLENGGSNLKKKYGI